MDEGKIAMASVLDALASFKVGVPRSSDAMTNPTEAWVPKLTRVAEKSLDGLDVTATEEQYKYTLKCAIGLVTNAIKVSAGLRRLTRRAAELERELRALAEGQEADLIKPG